MADVQIYEFCLIEFLTFRHLTFENKRHNLHWIFYQLDALNLNKYNKSNLMELCTYIVQKAIDSKFFVLDMTLRQGDLLFR